MEKYFIALFHVLDHFRPFATLFFSLKKLIILAAGGSPPPPPFVENSAKKINFFFEPFPQYKLDQISAPNIMTLTSLSMPIFLRVIGKRRSRYFCDRNRKIYFLNDQIQRYHSKIEPGFASLHSSFLVASKSSNNTSLNSI